jgi:hypothetical protein
LLLLLLLLLLQWHLHTWRYGITPSLPASPLPAPQLLLLLLLLLPLLLLQLTCRYGTTPSLPSKNSDRNSPNAMRCACGRQKQHCA